MRRKISIKKRASLAAAIAAVSVLVSGLFTSPGELLEDRQLPPTPPAIVDVLIEDVPDTEGGGDDTAVCDEKKQKGIRAWLRQKIKALPVIARVFVCIPLWCIGTVLMSAFSALLGNVLAPAAYVLIRYLCIAGLVLAGVLAIVKCVAPDVPLKKVLDKRNVLAVLLGTSVLGLAGSLMQIIYPEGMKVYEMVEGTLILAAMMAACVKIVKLKKPVQENEK